MSVENPGNPRKLVKKKILLHCVSFDKLYLNLSVFLVLEIDNSQFPIVGENQQAVKIFSKKISTPTTRVTQLNNSVCKC